MNIDFESDGHEDTSSKNRNYLKNNNLDEEVLFSDNVDIPNNNDESQPLLGGIDHQDACQVIYNQFPSE